MWLLFPPPLRQLKAAVTHPHLRQYCSAPPTGRGGTGGAFTAQKCNDGHPPPTPAPFKISSAAPQVPAQSKAPSAPAVSSRHRRLVSGRARLTRVEEDRPLEIGVLFGADVQTPALGQEAFDGLDLRRQGQLRAAAPAGRRLLQQLGSLVQRPERRFLVAGVVVARLVGQYPVEHAGLRGLHRLEVHAVLRQPQHEQGRPAAAHQDQLLVQGQLLEAGHVLDEAQRLHQHGRSRLTRHLRALESHSPLRAARAAQPRRVPSRARLRGRRAASRLLLLLALQDVVEDAALPPAVGAAAASVYAGHGRRRRKPRETPLQARRRGKARESLRLPSARLSARPLPGP